MRNTNTNPHRLFNFATGHSPEISNEFARIVSKKKSDWINNGWANEVCAITLEKIKDLVENNKAVVLFVDGHFYQKEALIDWLRVNPRSPISQQPVGIQQDTHLNITTNQLIRLTLFAIGQVYLSYFLFYISNLKELSLQIAANPCDAPNTLTCEPDQHILYTQLNHRQTIYLQKALVRFVISVSLLGSFVYLQLKARDQQHTTVINFDEVTMPLEQVIDIVTHAHHQNFNAM